MIVVNWKERAEVRRLREEVDMLRAIADLVIHMLDAIDGARKVDAQHHISSDSKVRESARQWSAASKIRAEIVAAIDSARGDSSQAQNMQAQDRVSK